MWTAVVLGVAQDGGMPQTGCRCATCAAAREPNATRAPAHVACLGLHDAATGRLFLLDATPDLPFQVHHPALLAQPPPTLAGIFLTHAHMGHYTGLMHLGREAMAARALPVYATDGMHAFLAANAPWSALVTGGHIAPRPVLAPDASTDAATDATDARLGPLIDLGGGLTVTAVPVPHRDENGTGTVGYIVRGPRRAVLYIPDIDRWEELAPATGGIHGLLAQVDRAYLDATFYSGDELPGRDMRQVPHPLVTDTMARLADVAAKVALIHLNHTNPLFHSPHLATDRGFHVAAEGETFAL